MMLPRGGVLAVCVFALVLTPGALGSPSYRSKFPNSGLVTGCDGGAWNGVGHLRASGGGARNPFGLDFAAAGRTWTTELCQMDSDGDGVANGVELGDPDCVWTEGADAAVTVGITHPGLDCRTEEEGGDGDVPTSGGGGVSDTARTFAVHGIVMLTAWGFIAPLGAVFPLFWRNTFSTPGRWFQVHRALMMFAIALTIVGYAIAFDNAPAGRDHTDDDVDGGGHKRIGLVVFILALVQGANGVGRPHKPATPEEKPSKIRVAWLYFHRLCAFLCILLGLFQVMSGADLVTLYHYGTDMEAGQWQAAYGGLMAAAVCVGIAGFVMRKKSAPPPPSGGDVELNSK